MRADDLREIIGGRWAISWQLFWLNAPLSVLFVPLVQLADDRSAPLLLWTFASAFGYLGVAPVLILADKTLLRRRHHRSVPISWVAGVGFILGSGKSLLTTQFVRWVDPSLVVPGVQLRATVTGLMIAATLPIGAFLMYQIDLLRQARFELLEDRIRYSQIQLREQELARQLRITAAEAVSSDISDSMNAIRTTLNRTADWALDARWTELGNTITEIAESKIRPLSRELWQDGIDVRPSLQVAELFRVAVVRYCMSPWFVSLIYGFSIFAWGARWNGPLFQLAWTAFLSVLVFSVHKPIRWVVARTGSWFLAVSLPALFGAGVALLPVLFDAQAKTGSLIASVLVSSAWMGLVSLYGAFGAAALANPSTLLQQLEADVSEQRIRAWAAQRETRRISRELAKHIHGRLQSRLMAAGLSPGTAPSTTLKALERTLSTPLEDFLNPEAHTLRETIARACQNWQGLLTVTCNIDAAIELGGVDTEFIGAVVEEALTNASRHGWADQVNVAMHMEGHDLVVTVTDNGIGPRIGEPGLGSRLYSSDPRAEWALEPRDGGGSVLRMRLPVE